MKKRWIASILISVLCIGMFSACGNDTGAENGSNTEIATDDESVDNTVDDEVTEVEEESIITEKDILGFTEEEDPEIFELLQEYSFTDENLDYLQNLCEVLDISSDKAFKTNYKVLGEDGDMIGAEWKYNEPIPKFGNLSVRFELLQFAQSIDEMSNDDIPYGNVKEENDVTGAKSLWYDQNTVNGHEYNVYWSRFDGVVPGETRSITTICIPDTSTFMHFEFGADTETLQQELGISTRTLGGDEEGSYMVRKYKDTYYGIINAVLFSDAASEEPTTSETINDSDWAGAYADYISTKANNSATEWQYQNSIYALIYIDNNDVPELFLDGPDWASGQTIITYHNGTLTEQNFNGFGVSYIERSGLINYSEAHTGGGWDEIWKLENGSFTELASGSIGMNTEPFTYKWEGVSVTEEEYYSRIAEYYDSSKASYPGSDRSYSYNDIMMYLNTVK